MATRCVTHSPQTSHYAAPRQHQWQATPSHDNEPKMFAMRHPYGSYEVAKAAGKSLALQARDPFRVLLRCHPFSWNWCLRVGSEARTPSAGHQTPPARYHSEGFLPPCHGALRGLGGSPMSLRLLLLKTFHLFCQGSLTGSLEWQPAATSGMNLTPYAQQLQNIISSHPLFSHLLNIDTV